MKRNKIIFMDRDGVINQDSIHYIKNWAEFEFLPGSLDALARLHRHGYDVIIITNQSIINRGIAKIETLHDILQRMTETVKSLGGNILDIFFCPHRPDEGCDCRKPLPGMILSARDKYRIDLNAACMIGDSAKDIECGKNAGCGTTILVQTGNGGLARKQLTDRRIHPDYIAADLSDATNWILSR